MSTRHPGAWAGIIQAWESSSPSRQRRMLNFLGIYDDDDCVISETQVSNPSEAINPRVAEIIQKEFDKTDKQFRAEYIRNYLREMGLIVLRTPTTAEQLEFDLRQQYTIFWYLLPAQK